MPQDGYNLNILAEFKSSLVADKVASKEVSLSAKLDGMFPPTQEEQALQVQVDSLQQLAQQKYEQQVQRESEALLSDKAVSTPLGYAANLGLNLTSKVADVAIGQPSRLGINLADIYDEATIPTEDKERFQVIKDKREASKQIGQTLREMAAQPKGTYTRAQIDEVRAQYESTRLTEEEEVFSDPNKQRTAAGTSSFKRLQEGEARTEMREVMTQPFDQLEKWVNKGRKEKAIAKIGRDVERAAVSFEEGNYGEATGAILASIGNLVVKDTAAATELLVDSAAHMIALAKSAPVAITTIGSDMLSSSTKEFEEEHKRPPEPDELAYMALLVYGSVGLDAIGAKVSLGAATGFRSAVNVGKKLNLKLPKSLVAVGGQLGKVAGSAPGKVIKATVVEGITETAQDILEQQAIKQDFSKVDIKKAVVAGVIGAAIGGGLSVPSTAVKAADSIRTTLNKSSSEYIEKVNKAGVGKVDDVIAASKESGKVNVGINEILNTNFSDLSEKQQDKRLDDFEELIDIYAADVNFDKDTLLKYDTQYTDLVDIVIDSRADSSVQEAVDILEKGPSPEAAETFASHVRNSATISPVDIKRSLGSDSSFRESATPEQLKVVEDRHEFNEAVATARNIENVTDNVLKGSKDSKFVGIEIHLLNAKKAIRKNDNVALDTVISKLNNFLTKQKAKLEIRTHSPKFLTQIQNEVNLIEATIQQIKTLSGGVQAEVQPKAKPEVVAKDKEQPFPKKPKEPTVVSDFFIYKDGKPVKVKSNIATLSAEFRKGKSKAELATMRVEYTKILAEIADIQYTTLKDIDITREEGEEAVTFNAAQEYETLTKRMSRLETIWKECK